MNRFFSNKKLIVILISVIVFISILSFSLSSIGSNNFIQTMTNDVTAFVGRAFSRPVNAVLDTFETIDTFQDTYTENKRLKSQIEGLYAIQAELGTVREENESLRQELDINESMTEYQTLAANVIARSPDLWVEQIIIDRGQQNDLEVGMPVTSNTGLIGQISEVNPTSSKVILLSNINSSSNQVSAEIIMDPERNIDEDNADSFENSDDNSEDNSRASEDVVYGVIDGYDFERNMLVMNQITSEMTIEEGMTVTTSGLGGAYPRGIVIGEVRETNIDNQGLSQEVYIEPKADFNNLRNVTVVQRSAQMLQPNEQATEAEEE